MDAYEITLLSAYTPPPNFFCLYEDCIVEKRKQARVLPRGCCVLRLDFLQFLTKLISGPDIQPLQRHMSNLGLCIKWAPIVSIKCKGKLVSVLN
jgi:hypothetical protein